MSAAIRYAIRWLDPGEPGRCWMRGEGHELVAGWLEDANLYDSFTEASAYLAGSLEEVVRIRVNDDGTREVES